MSLPVWIYKSILALSLLFLFYQFGPVYIVRFFPQIIEPVSEIIYQSRVALETNTKRLEFTQMPAVATFTIPVLRAKSYDFNDTWGEARSEGRTHEGTDIFAKRGTLVISPTEAIVSRIATSTLGGNIVYTINPGNERFYFAHLDKVDSFLVEGMIISKGTIIGTVGNTGNASGTPPHLHFGIYGIGGARNPFERLIVE